VSSDGTDGWRTTLTTTDPASVDLAWIAAGTADLIAAFDKSATTLTIWDATSTSPRLSETVTDARLGATGLLAIAADGTLRTLTLTGGTVPYLTPLQSPGTPLAATTTGHYLLLNESGALTLDGHLLPDCGQGTPKAVTLTHSIAAASWPSLTVAWTTSATTVAKVTADVKTPQRRPVPGALSYLKPTQPGRTGRDGSTQAGNTPAAAAERTRHAPVHCSAGGPAGAGPASPLSLLATCPEGTRALL